MMNKSTLMLSALSVSMALYLTGVANAHGKKKHEEAAQYDAVTEEFGRYDPALVPVKTIEVSMADTMRFTPSQLTISAGDVVKFVVSNDGQLKHEFVLGTTASLQEHAELMVKFPNMEHEEPYMAHVDPGNNREIIWQFSNTGTFEFGCLLPGHFAAGMRGSITVN